MSDTAMDRRRFLSVLGAGTAMGATGLTGVSAALFLALLPFGVITAVLVQNFLQR